MRKQLRASKPNPVLLWRALLQRPTQHPLHGSPPRCMARPGCRCSSSPGCSSTSSSPTAWQGARVVHKAAYKMPTGGPSGVFEARAGVQEQLLSSGCPTCCSWLQDALLTQPMQMVQSSSKEALN